MTFQNNFEQKLEDKIKEAKKTAFIESIGEINLNEAILDIKQINKYALETSTSIETILNKISKAEITKIEIPERIQTPIALTNGQIIAQSSGYRQLKIFDVTNRTEISNLPEETYDPIATADGGAISLSKGTIVYNTIGQEIYNNTKQEITTTLDSLIYQANISKKLARQTFNYAIRQGKIQSNNMKWSLKFFQTARKEYQKIEKILENNPQLKEQYNTIELLTEQDQYLMKEFDHLPNGISIGTPKLEKKLKKQGLNVKVEQPTSRIEQTITETAKFIGELVGVPMGILSLYILNIILTGSEEDNNRKNHRRCRDNNNDEFIPPPTPWIFPH